jgi:hypothetical protein
VQERPDLALRGLQGQAEKVPVHRLRVRRPLGQHFEKVSNQVFAVLLHRDKGFNELFLDGYLLCYDRL